MSQALTDATIVLASAAAVPIVTGVVNVAKPFLELLPWANPRNLADKPTHDATIQAFNAIVTLGVILGEIALLGYISDPSQFWIVAAQVIAVAVGADVNFRGSNKTTTGSATAGSVALPAPTAASVASALSAGIAAMEAPAAPPAPPAAPAAPLHQQWSPSAATAPEPAPDDATEPPAADELPSALDTPTQPVPVVSPASASASAI